MFNTEAHPLPIRGANSFYRAAPAKARLVAPVAIGGTGNKILDVEVGSAGRDEDA